MSAEPFDEDFPQDDEYIAACLPPCHVLPLCSEYLGGHSSILCIHEEKLLDLVEETIAKGQLFAELDKLKDGKEAVSEILADKGVAAAGLCAATSPSSQTATEDKLWQISRILAYNVMNFSFFPDKGCSRWFIRDEQTGKNIGDDDEAFAIVASLKRWERSGHYEHWLQAQGATSAGICWADGNYMESLTLEDIRSLFQPAEGAGALPLLELRLKCLHSLASGLYRKMSLHDFLELCQKESGFGHEGSSTEGYGPMKVGHFVSLLCRHVPAFRDLRRAEGSNVILEFAKRPQLTIGMLHGDSLVRFADMDNVTVFSDYRLPQLFRSKGIIEVLNGCTPGDDEELWINAHLPLETALRAATLVVAEQMRQQLNLRRSNGKPVQPADLDYYLWQITVDLDAKGELLPFHKTRTFSY